MSRPWPLPGSPAPARVKGESSGVLVVADFAHHPTAIRVTIEAAAQSLARRRLWAVFEPRSNTMRRKVFEREPRIVPFHGGRGCPGAVSRANLSRRGGTVLASHTRRASRIARDRCYSCGEDILATRPA